MIPASLSLNIIPPTIGIYAFAYHPSALGFCC